MNEPLSPQQMKALRHADHVIFAHHVDGTGSIRATVDPNHSSTGFEQSVTIPVESRSGGMTGRTGFESFASYHEGWRTFVHHVLRTGDVLVLHFRPGAGTQDYLRAAKGDPDLLDGDDDNGRETLRYTGLQADELWLIIERKDKRLHFLMKTRVTPENTARMCARVF